MEGPSPFRMRVGDVLANTENYLPGGVKDWFGQNGVRSQAGKHYAAA